MGEGKASERESERERERERGKERGGRDKSGVMENPSDEAD